MKLVINTLEDVAEGLRGEYEAKNGKFFLKMEGDNPAIAEANTKIAEFRDKNIALLKEVEELRPLKTQYGDLDPVEAREAISKVKALGKKGVKDADDLDSKLKLMLDEALKPVKEQLKVAEDTTKAERLRADDYLFTTKIQEEFVKAGGKTNAVGFVVGLAKENFEVKDGKVVTKTGKFSTEKPAEALTTTEWLKSLSTEHDYVFQPSSGGGTPAKGGGPAGGTSVKAKTGQTILKDPSPQQLGEYSADIRAGKVKIEYSTQ